MILDWLLLDFKVVMTSRVIALLGIRRGPVENDGRGLAEYFHERNRDDNERLRFGGSSKEDY